MFLLDIFYIKTIVKQYNPFTLDPYSVDAFFHPWTTSREPTKYPLSMLSFHEKGQMGEPFSAP